MLNADTKTTSSGLKTFLGSVSTSLSFRHIGRKSSLKRLSRNAREKELAFKRWSFFC